MFRVDVHHHFEFTADPTLSKRLNQVLAAIAKQEETMSAALDRLAAEIAESRTVSQSAITLIQGLTQQVRELKDDPTALNAWADELDFQTNALQAAMTQNTIAEDEEEAPVKQPTDPIGGVEPIVEPVPEEGGVQPVFEADNPDKAEN